MPARERDITTRILKTLRAGGAFAEKNHGNAYTRIGTPDIYACYQGRFIAIEVKRPGEHPTPAQVAFLNELTLAGAVTAVMTSHEQVYEMWEQVFHERHPVRAAG